MAIRRDLPPVMIFLAVFQDFDHGQEIEQFTQARFNLQPGDEFEWECGDNLAGMATVVSIGDLTKDKEYRWCTLKKIS